MKSQYLRTLIGSVALAALVTGCVVHEHGHHHYAGTRVRIGAGHVCTDACDHYCDGGHWYRMRGHVHGPSCGHALRGGVWVVIP